MTKSVRGIQNGENQLAIAVPVALQDVSKFTFVWPFDRALEVGVRSDSAVYACQYSGCFGSAIEYQDCCFSVSLSGVAAR